MLFAKERRIKKIKNTQ